MKIGILTSTAALCLIVGCHHGQRIDASQPNTTSQIPVVRDQKVQDQDLSDSDDQKRETSDKAVKHYYPRNAHYTPKKHQSFSNSLILGSDAGPNLLSPIPETDYLEIQTSRSSCVKSESEREPSFWNRCPGNDLASAVNGPVYLNFPVVTAEQVKPGESGFGPVVDINVGGSQITAKNRRKHR